MSTSSSKKPYAELIAVANRFPVEHLLKHPKTGNHCRFAQIPYVGVSFCASTFSAKAGETLRVQEGSLISYTSNLKYGDNDERVNRSENLARVLAIAVTDGVGAKLDPPHLAVMVLATDMQSVYFRLVHPVDVYSVLTRSNVFKWFSTKRHDFSLNKLPLLLLSADYGQLNVDYISECLDATGSLKPSVDIPYYMSSFVRLQTAGNSSVRIPLAVWEFEYWLQLRGYHPGPGVLATDMLKVYHTGISVTEHVRNQLQAHATRIGFIEKD